MLILLPGRSGARDNRRVPDAEIPDAEMPGDEMEAESRATDRLTLFSDAVVARGHRGGRLSARVIQPPVATGRAGSVTQLDQEPT